MHVAKRILNARPFWKSSLIYLILFWFVPHRAFPTWWARFPVSKTDRSHLRLSERYWGDFCRVWQARRWVDIIDCRLWFIDNISAYSWTVNIIVENGQQYSVLRFIMRKSQPTLETWTLQVHKYITQIFSISAIHSYARNKYAYLDIWHIYPNTSIFENFELKRFRSRLDRITFTWNCSRVLLSLVAEAALWIFCNMVWEGNTFRAFLRHPVQPL